MKCPTPCEACGEITELDALHFHSAYCDCSPFGGCQHGLCDECFKIWQENDEDDDAA